MYLNHRATLLCTHGGTVMLVPPAQRSLFITESPVLTEPDLLQATIIGCPQVGPGLKPCLRILSILEGRALQIQVDGEIPILDSLVALTDGCAPGTVTALDDGESNATPCLATAQAATLALAAERGSALCAICGGK